MLQTLSIRSTQQVNDEQEYSSQFMYVIIQTSKAVANQKSPLVTVRNPILVTYISGSKRCFMGEHQQLHHSPRVLLTRTQNASDHQRARSLQKSLHEINPILRVFLEGPTTTVEQLAHVCAKVSMQRSAMYS